MKLNALLMLLILFLGCSKANSDDQSVDPVNPSVNESIDNHVVAHRGAWKEFGLPENSVAALQKAMEIKCYASECDIQMTKDKKVVVYHDEKIGGRYFKDLAYTDLGAHLLANGEKVPLLSDLLDKVVANKKIKLWIDVKSLSDAAGGNAWSIQAAEAAAAEIRSKGAQKHVAFIVGRKAVLDKAILTARSEWPSAYMNDEYSPASFIAGGYNWANFNYTKFYNSSTNNNAALINEYTDRNIKLTVYTVDTEDAMDWFLSKNNVSAISSNYPFKLLQKIRK